MPLEIEAKMKLADAADRDAVQHRIVQHGGTPIGTFLEHNTYFDTAERALLAAGSGLRLRVAEVQGSQEPLVVLTFKGPKMPGPLKSREELELRISDADTARTMLNRLGYHRISHFDKQRQSWRLGECRIELDMVPTLGHFVEIEGPDEPTVMAIRQQLGLSDRPLISEGYVGLLAERAGNLKPKSS